MHPNLCRAASDGVQWRTGVSRRHVCRQRDVRRRVVQSKNAAAQCGAAKQMTAKQISDLVDAGRDTRFRKGNRAGAGNPRAGRPRKTLVDKCNRYSEWSLDRLHRIAKNDEDPRQFDALKELARLTTPRRREVTGEGGGQIDFQLSVEAFRLMAAQARSGEG